MRTSFCTQHMLSPTHNLFVLLYILVLMVGCNKIQVERAKAATDPIDETRRKFHACSTLVARLDLAFACVTRRFAL